MTQEDVIKLVKGGQLPQYEIKDAEASEETGEVIFTLERREDAVYTCSHCGQQTFIAYDTLSPRLVEDLPLGQFRMYWRFSPVRIRCPHCGTVHVEVIDGLTPHSRQTDRFRAYLAAKCDDTSVSAVARDYGLNDETVRRIDKEFLARRELITPTRTCEVLGIDEIAIRKGHVYATVFYDHTSKTVLHMLQGRDSKSVHAFFRERGEEWCRSVRVVTCDLWRVYKSAVRKFLPNAIIVTDKFHVFQYAGDALEELRRSECNRQADKTDFDLKRGRFLLLKAGARLDEKGKARIEKLKETNKDIYTAYLLKEQVITFYEQKTRADAEDFLGKWASSCIASGMTPFVKLGRRLLRHAESILEYFVHRVSNAFAEGINNKIKVVKRMAFGFRDFEYFRLKILSVTGYLRAIPKRPLFAAM